MSAHKKLVDLMCTYNLYIRSTTNLQHIKVMEFGFYFHLSLYNKFTRTHNNALCCECDFYSLDGPVKTSYFVSVYDTEVSAGLLSDVFSLFSVNIIICFIVFSFSFYGQT